jgi:hypothetical protein
MNYKKRLSSVRSSIANYSPRELNPSSLLNENNTARVSHQDGELIFYEYDIVDKKGEEQYLTEQLRNKGLCICSRWIFVLLGNLFILLLVGGIIGLLYYVNLPPDPVKAPLEFNETCITGRTSCNTVANLQCINGKKAFSPFEYLN